MPIAIQDQIKVLVELQSVDLEIHKLKKDLAEQPILQKQLEAEFDKKKAGLKAAEDELKSQQLKQKDKEGGLQASEEKIKKLQGQLYQLKSNKEYSAMELEIKGIKADKSVLEEEILILLDAVDAVKAKVTKEKELLAIEDKKTKELIATIQKKSTDIQAQIVQLEEKRKTFLPNVDPKFLPQYERLLKGRDGLAVAPLKGNSCGGCHLELPPQRVNEVRMQEKMVTCESCARILYCTP